MMFGGLLRLAGELDERKRAGRDRGRDRLRANGALRGGSGGGVATSRSSSR